MNAGKVSSWQPRTEAEWDEWENARRGRRPPNTQRRPPNPPQLGDRRPQPRRTRPTEVVARPIVWQLGDPASTAARCPQYWAGFTVRGGTGTYQVLFADVIRSKLKCTCPAFKFSGHIGCKHIDRVLRHGCFGTSEPVPGSPARGPNDLASVEDITVEMGHPHFNSQPTGRLCSCGEPMRVPAVRMVDDADRQLVRVQFDEHGVDYTYANIGAPLNIGDMVTIPIEQYVIPRHAIVVGFGSDYAGPLVELRAIPCSVAGDEYRSLPLDVQEMLKRIAVRVGGGES